MAALQEKLPGDYWIPYCISVSNSVIRVFDDQCHQKVDYKVDKLSAQFVFNNPNQTAACGCGESVQLEPATGVAP